MGNYKKSTEMPAHLEYMLLGAVMFEWNWRRFNGFVRGVAALAIWMDKKSKRIGKSIFSMLV